MPAFEQSGFIYLKRHVQKAVTNTTVIEALQYTQYCVVGMDTRDRVKQRPSLSSLPFQVSLYYGALYSIVFAILIGSAAVSKVRPIYSDLPLNCQFNDTI
jgi:hypothetical protein